LQKWRARSPLLIRMPHKYGSISRYFVSLIMCTGGEYRGVRHDRHDRHLLAGLNLTTGAASLGTTR
jgi:hypothetical protein